MKFYVICIFKHVEGNCCGKMLYLYHPPQQWGWGAGRNSAGPGFELRWVWSLGVEEKGEREVVNYIRRGSLESLQERDTHLKVRNFSLRSQGSQGYHLHILYIFKNIIHFRVHSTLCDHREKLFKIFHLNSFGAKTIERTLENSGKPYVIRN